MKKKIIILGAGPAGLISGWLLAKNNFDVSIYEMNNQSGGMCRSWKWNGHILDTGPHIFHTYDKWLIKFWKKNFSNILQTGKYFSKNVINNDIKNSYEYPISYESIKKYPKKISKKILLELKELKKNSTPKNFKEFVENQVGKTLTEMFFTGYPEKVWGIKTDKLTAEWAPKRIQITKKNQPFFQKQFTAVSKYGTGNFYKHIEKLLKKLNGKIYFNKKVTNIITSNKKINSIVFNNNKKLKINDDEIIISTLPITFTSNLLGYRSKLKFNGIRSVYVSIKRKRIFPKKVNWLYFADPKIIFNRVSEASTMTKTIVADNKTYLTCEITFSKNDKIDKMNFDDLSQKVIEDLIHTGLISNKNEIDKVTDNKEKHVYPVQFTNYRSELARTRQQIEKYDQIYSLGTGGEFDYSDSQIIFHKAIDLVEILSQKENASIQTQKENNNTKLNKTIKLGKKFVGENYKPYIIAEAGLNHNGDIKLAKKLIYEAKKSNCDAVKFQTFSAQKRISKEAKSAKYFEKADGQREDIYEMFDRLSFNFNEFKEIFGYARKIGIEIFSTPFSLEDVDLLEKLNVKFYKIASVDCVNLKLIEKIGKTNKPLILSTGMSDLSIVEDAIKAFKATGNSNLIILHCLSSYPSNEKEMNLRVIKSLKEIYKVPVGLSDHYPGLEVSLIALGIGANMIERHFTLDKNLEGPDHILSSTPSEISILTRFANNMNEILGDGQKKIQPSEYYTINTQRKCLYAKKDIMKGKIIGENDIEIKGPGGGLLPKYYNVILGKKARQSIKKDFPITWSVI